MTTMNVMPTSQPAPGSLEEALRAALGSFDRKPRLRAIGDAAESADPEALIGMVGNQADSISRNAAMEALTRSGTRSLPTLVRALRHPDNEVVMFAAGILGKTRDGVAIPHLVGLLNHADINVAQQAIESLAQLRSSVAVSALVATLDRDPWLRFAAVHALGEIGDQRAVRPLVPLLADDMVRGQVIQALGKIGSPEALTHLARALRDSTDPESFGACLRAMADALERHPNHEMLRNIEAWSELRSPDAHDFHQRLVRVLSGGEPDVPGRIEPGPEAPDAAAGRQIKESAAAIVHALRLRPLYTALVLAGRDATLREMLEFCAVSLGAEIVPTLRQGLGQRNANVRMLACQCLGALGSDDASEAIAALLTDEEAIVRAAALEALARLHADRHAHRVIPLLTDGDAGVRRAAVATLARLDAEVITLVLITARPQTADRLIPTLEVMRANPFPDQRPFIERSLAHEAPEVRVAAVLALAAQSGDVASRLAPSADDADRAVRRAALLAIAGARNTRARRILLQKLELHRSSRVDVVDALGALRDPAVVPQLVRLLGALEADVRRAAVAALGQFASTTALRHVTAAARDADEGVRREVARVLSTSDDRAALETLERLCVDPSPVVADLARKALSRAA